MNAAPPAESAKSANYIKSQIAYSIYDGRYKADKPRTSVAPPVQLFHPVFGRFKDAVKGDHALPDELIGATVEYMKAASALYPNEEQRRAALTPLLRKILGVNIQMVVGCEPGQNDSGRHRGNGDRGIAIPDPSRGRQK